VRRCLADQQERCKEQTDLTDHAQQDARHARLYHIPNGWRSGGPMLRRVRTVLHRRERLSTRAGPAWPGSRRVSRRRACRS
jgi:hypothetical protein